jgi:hypothetical protein
VSFAAITLYVASQRVSVVVVVVVVYFVIYSVRKLLDTRLYTKFIFSLVPFRLRFTLIRHSTSKFLLSEHLGKVLRF